MTRDEIIEYLLPILALTLGLLAWEAAVRYYAVPTYILPAPSFVIGTLIKDWDTLFHSLIVTLSITFEALGAAVIFGVVASIVFTQWRFAERVFFPFAVAMQVTPVVAIAPLLLIYLNASAAVLVVAFLVAFFPILANTTLGLNSADHNLTDLFHLYGASRSQELMWLRLPSALPYFLAGLRIGGGLALIGAIVAEITAGTAGHGAGLAFRIVESGFQLNVSRMFAALLLISVSGITIYFVLSALSHMLLRHWHESAQRRDT
jgi:NitT/TauT family transport system permease protein